MKILLALAEGFEEIEALTVVDYLRRLDLKVDLVSITDDQLVRGAHSIDVRADRLLSDVSDDDYQGIVIPGGLPGATNLRDNPRVVSLVKSMDQEGKLVAAICAGPIVLAQAGVIDGKKLTSYPGFQEELEAGVYMEEAVVRDGNLITARGPALAVDFALEIADYLLGKEEAQKLKDDILYHYLKD